MKLVGDYSVDARTLACGTIDSDLSSGVDHPAEIPVRLQHGSHVVGAARKVDHALSRMEDALADGFLAEREVSLKNMNDALGC